MTIAPADRIAALTPDQLLGLAQVLHVAQWIGTLSYSKRLGGLELEALLLRGYGLSLGEAAARLAQLPHGVDTTGRELLLVHLELEPAGKFWGARGTLWGDKSTTQLPQVEVHVLDQPAREVALALAFVQFARSLVSSGAGEALRAFESALGTACDQLEDALYPDPPLEEKVRVMRERHEASLARQESDEPEPSFHGSGGVE
jgi:hypothetical protein